MYTHVRTRTHTHAHAQGFLLLTAGVPVPEADGYMGSDDLRHGHNETVPCGAYGCRNCVYSPGNACADNAHGATPSPGSPVWAIPNPGNRGAVLA